MAMETKSTGPACKRYEALLDDYLGGVLDTVSEKEAERHLGDCVNCRNAFEAAREGARIFQTAGFTLRGASAPGPEFARLAMARIRAEKEQRAAERSGFWQPLVSFAWRFAATAVVALALLLTYAVRGRGRSRQVVGPIGQTQIVDVFTPDPTRTPADQDEVLLLMAETDHANQ